MGGKVSFFIVLNFHRGSSFSLSHLISGPLVTLIKAVNLFYVLLLEMHRFHLLCFPRCGLKGSWLISNFYDMSSTPDYKRYFAK